LRLHRLAYHALVRRGDRVRVLDNRFSGGPDRLGDMLADVEWLDGDVRKSLADISQVQSVLGYKLIVSFDMGLERMVASFAGHGAS
jgi:hypothetical protein